MQKIKTCLWFGNEAEDAAKLYTSLFHGKLGTTSYYGESAANISGQKKGSVLVQEFSVAGLEVMALNGGNNPAGERLFQFTPSFSFFVACDSEEEIDSLWKALSENGNVRMGLDKYPWADKYGWAADRFGVEWQLILSANKPKQKIVPALLFVDALYGKGESAIQFYTSLFKNSGVEMLHKDPESNAVMHARFRLAGQEFVLMEGQGDHSHKFNEAFSLVVNCGTQEEIDFFWEKFTKDGGQEGPCGWLKDKYGVSWQIVPSMLGEIMSSGGGEKAERTMSALLKMKKLDIEKLKNA